MYLDGPSTPQKRETIGIAGLQSLLGMILLKASKDFYNIILHCGYWVTLGFTSLSPSQHLKDGNLRELLHFLIVF